MSIHDMHDRLRRRLIKADYRSIGGGIYSQVFAKEGADTCVKVSNQIDAYLDYLEFASQAGWMGTHAPYVYAVNVIRRDGHGFYVVIMERLTTTLGRVYTYPAEIRDHARWQHDSVEWQERLRTLRQEVRHGSDDFHEGNWMVRKDGTLVLVDPFTGNGRTTLTRWRNRNPPPPITPHPLLAAA